MKMYHGQLSQIKEDNPLLFKNVSMTSKLGFPDVIMPGDVRNDLYLTLERGDFERGGKSTGKNIEVTVLVLDSEKNITKVHKVMIKRKAIFITINFQSCLWGASGLDGTSEYNSMIIYHHNSPAWAETVRLTLPIDKFAGAHIRLEFRHCSSKYEIFFNEMIFILNFLYSQGEKRQKTVRILFHSINGQRWCSSIRWPT